MDIMLTLSAYCVPGPEPIRINSPIIPAAQGLFPVHRFRDRGLERFSDLLKATQ